MAKDEKQKEILLKALREIDVKLLELDPPEDALMGGCACFAEALMNILGGEVWCSYEDKEMLDVGAPVHCTLKIGDNFLDVRGAHDKGYLRRAAYREYRRELIRGNARPGDNKKIIVMRATPDDYAMSRCDEKRIKEIENIIMESL